MKKIIMASAIALCAIIAIPAQAALANQPWRLTSVSYVKTGFWGPWVKACHWIRSEYVGGIYQAEMSTTYTAKYTGCPAPMSLGQ